MYYLKIIFIVFISILAIVFYLQAFDGPYARDLKLDQVCPPGQRGDYHSYKCGRYSFISTLNERVENISGISRWTLNDFELVLFLLFLPVLVIARNLYDYRTSRTQETSLHFGRLYFHSALVVINAGSVGLLPSIIMGLPTCLGEWCISTYMEIFLLSILTLLFAFLSSGITRYFLKRSRQVSSGYR